MSNYTLPLPAGVLSQPNLEVFPAPVVVVGDEIIQLTLSECFPVWILVTSGAGAGIEGAWVPGLDPTVRANKWFGFSVLQSTNSQQSFFAELDIGVGLAGFEVPVVNDIAYGWQAPGLPGGACLGTPYTAPLVPGIPAGSRVSIRVKDTFGLALNHLVMCNFWA